MNGMTFYSYLDEMQNFCLRASNAFKVIKPENPLLVDFYAAAEEGFFHQKQNCAAVDAGVPAGEVKARCIKEFKEALEKWENEAAYICKETADGKHGGNNIL